MKVYLAAPWADRDKAREQSKVITAAGFKVIEPWWDHPDVAAYGKDEISEEAFAELAEQAFKDIEGVLNADAMVLLNSQKSEGKAVEFGLRLLDPDFPIIVVGKRTNLFHYLIPDECFVGSVEEAVDILLEIEE